MGYLVNRAASMVAARFSDELKPHGVSLQAWRLLAALSQTDGQSLSELANHTGAELSYLSKSVVAAEEAGWVKRGASEADRRTVLVSLTGRGRALIRELVPRGEAIEAICLAKVSKRDREATLRTLRLVCLNLVPQEGDQTDKNRKLTVARRMKNKSNHMSPEVGNTD